MLPTQVLHTFHRVTTQASALQSICACIGPELMVLDGTFLETMFVLARLSLAIRRIGFLGRHVLPLYIRNFDHYRLSTDRSVLHG